jgi:HAE1 family hydrophobic/amphiphilic exporter-1
VWFAAFADWYHRLLEGALEHRARVLLSAGALLVVGVVVGSLLQRDVLPDVDQGAFTVRLDLPQGTPLEETDALATRVESVFLSDSAVEAVFARIGRQEAVAGVEDEGSGLNTAALDVRLREGARTRSVLERLRPRLAGFPPEVLSIETGAATALGKLLGGSEADLAIRVRGDDIAATFAHAGAIAERLQDVPSLTNVRRGTEEGQPEIRVEIDRERAATYGVEPRLIATTVEQYMRGEVATEFVDFNEKVPVLVRLPESARRSLETLRQLRVNGVPLRELVNTHDQVGPEEIHRLEQGRAVTVYADVSSGGLDVAVRDARAALRDVPPPRGIRVEIGGANEERDRSFRDLAFAFGLALLLVYMILAAQFESFVHPFTILLAVPLATVGAAIALFVTGGGLNTMSLIGLVILVGIVVNDAIVKVDFINQMRDQGMALREAILEAGRVRLRPILMTTVTTVFGLAPMAFGIGRGADLRAPLAIAVIGGLVSATALTLIVVPVAYDLFEEARLRIRSAVGLRAKPVRNVTPGPA